MDVNIPRNSGKAIQMHKSHRGAEEGASEEQGIWAVGVPSSDTAWLESPCPG